MRLALVAALAVIGSTSLQAADGRTVVWDGENGNPGGGWGPVAAQKVEAHSGKTALLFHGDGANWIGGGWNWHAYFPKDSGDDIHARRNLSFWFKAKVEGDLGSLVAQILSSNGGKSGDIDVVAYCPEALDGQWHLIEVPLIDVTGKDRAGKERGKDFDPAKAWGLDISSWSAGKRVFDIWLDDLAFDDEAVRPLTLPVSLPEPRQPRALGGEVADIAASIDLDAAGTAISPWIYGVAMADPTLATEIGATIRRAGGNPLSPHDWRHGFSNSGADWMFMNNGAENSPEKDWLVTFHGANKQAGFETYLSIPIMGRVAKDGSSSGFPLDQFPDQQAHDKNAGNGKKPLRDAKGDPVLDDQKHTRFEDIPADPDRDSIAVTPEEQCGILRFLIDTMKYGDAQHGGVRFLALDNEPALWNGTHRDMHPTGCSYDELWERTKACATILKQADPGVLIAGPTSWGWTEYFYSGLDQQLISQGKGTWDAPPDMGAHGGVPLTKWYLTKIADHKKSTGVQLIDALDVHFYPQNGLYDGGKRGDPKTQESRAQEPRVLWDPTFDDHTWMAHNKECETPGVVQLIPLMKRWIAECNPGMQLALGEYNFGGENDLSGGIAQAELFGVFAREGVDHAYYWFAPPMNSSTWFAFKLWRNPDGKHTAFADRLLPSTVSAPTDVSLFAGKDSKSGKLTLVLVNKRAAKSARVALTLPRALPAQEVVAYEYSASDPGCIGQLPPRHVGGEHLGIDLPAMSALRFDLQP